MKVWQWFQANGDRVLAFLTMLSATLQSVDGLSPQVTKALMMIGIVATVAHQCFFPNVSPGAKQ